MSVYKKFCRERFDKDGRLAEFSVEYPKDFNFGYDVVDAIADSEPNKRALVWCNTENEERIFDFADIKRYSNRVANVLAEAGIKRGDRVLVMLKRHYEYWFVAVALHKLGAVLIPATHMLTGNDLEYRLRVSDAAAIICTPQNDVPEKILAALKNIAASPMLWCVKTDGIEGFRDLTRDMENASEVFERVPTLATDPMLMYFTSGTTGKPKGVVHDFTYPLAHIITAKYWQGAEENGLHFAVAETGWAKASYGKLYGQWLVGCAVMVYDFDNFEPKQLTSIINRYKVTSFCAPPTVYRYLIRKGVPSMPALRHACTAGEKLSPEVFRRFTESTGIQLREGFGQTESTLIMGNLIGSEPVAGSMGTVSPMYRVELHDKHGNVVPVGEIGEVVVVPPENGRQIGIFCEYLDDAKHYEHVWRGGVYHTGDAAWRDENGYYWFHGRFDDIIKTGGFRVGPYEVEEVLAEHPAVEECAVVGVPDALRGQAIKAVVVLAEGYSPTKELEKEIKDFCNGKLAEYKWVRILEFATKVQKTISEKIKKTELR